MKAYFMLIKKIALPWITVSDIERAKKLYVETLGFQIHEEQKDFGWLEVRCGSEFIGIWQAGKESEDKPGQNAVLTFEVDDILKAKEFLEKKGVKITSEIIEMPVTFKMLSFVDMDGNKFQLYQNLK